MDFAALMKSQIDAGKKGKSDSKYTRKAEVEAQRRDEYEREQARQEAERVAKLEKKRKYQEDEADRERVLKEKKLKLAEESARRRDEEQAAKDAERRKRLGLPELEQKEEIVDDDIAEDELRELLQSLGEPRALFAETHVQRLQRYRDLTKQVKKMSNGPIPTSLELVEEKDMRLENDLPSTQAGKEYVRRKIASYFDMILREWAKALVSRSKDVKESAAGKQAYNNFATAVSNLVPLFRKLEDEIPDIMLKSIVEIAYLAQSKRYVDANDAYLRLSIGNAAWPIGVTMVGIHERSAREKLNEDGNTAHIMSDEITRKMLQENAVKDGNYERPRTWFSPRARASAPAFIGRLGGNQEFIVDRHDATNATIVAKEPDAAPGMTLREQFDLAPFLTPGLWKAAAVEGFGEHVVIIMAKTDLSGTMLLVFLTTWASISPDTLPTPPDAQYGYFDNAAYIGPLTGGISNFLIVTLFTFGLGVVSGAHLNQQSQLPLSQQDFVHFQELCYILHFKLVVEHWEVCLSEQDMVQEITKLVDVGCLKISCQ
ncbi:hypothetical protein MRB53_040043 [Persea americana]|nr:hypothetical protein MRB53_040043 [Persea americana]